MATNVVQTNEKNNITKRIWIAIACIATVLLLVYFGLSIYFMDHFYFGTKIGNVDISGQTAVEAEEKLQKTLDEYKLEIIERDGTLSYIAGNEIALVIDWSTKPESYISRQNGFAWVIKVFQPDIYEADGTVLYDDEKLTECIVNLPAMKAEKQVAAVDAKVSEYDAKQGYTLIPAVPGTVVNVEQFTSNIQTCIVALEDKLDMTQGDNYVSPVVTDDNEKLLAAIDQLNLALKSVITYQVGSSTQTLDASTFQPWLYIKEDFTVGLEEEALTAYVKSLASAYNTCYSTKNFMTSYGQEIKITNSHYGWRVDNEAEKAAIVEDVLSGTAVSRDLKYNMTANSHEGNDYGDSYVEINLTAQHLFLYVNGQVVLESDFVSGNSQNKWDTPTGIWGLTYKTKDAVLRGDNYATPVSYWMPYAGNVGMHDATWRSEFGGTIYKRDGSHGCINLPKGKAKQIYEYVRQGFPVIVYHLAGTESEKGIAMDQGYALSQEIKAIGTVTLSAEAKILACRAQYDALSDLAKTYVTNYQLLLDAEKSLESLKATTNI